MDPSALSYIWTGVCKLKTIKGFPSQKMDYNIFREHHSQQRLDLLLSI